jgi:hypothetical protein
MGWVNDELYIFANGFQMQREDGKTPNGNDISGRWVLRDDKFNWIDFDTYRHNLCERNNLTLE